MYICVHFSFVNMTIHLLYTLRPSVESFRYNGTFALGLARKVESKQPFSFWSFWILREEHRGRGEINKGKKKRKRWAARLSV